MSRNAQAVRDRKAQRPDLYCPRCLWMTGGGPCPRHGGPEWTPEREEAARAKSRAPAPTATRSEIGAAIDVVRVLAEAVRAAGEIPSGHLYAHVMDRLSIENYEAAIALLKRAGLVAEDHHLLRWSGPALEAP